MDETYIAELRAKLTEAVALWEDLLARKEAWPAFAAKAEAFTREARALLAKGK